MNTPETIDYTTTDVLTEMAHLYEREFNNYQEKASALRRGLEHYKKMDREREYRFMSSK